MDTLQELTSILTNFRDERDWGKFHNPKDLALAINIETSELLELFLWKDMQDVDIENVELELADIFAYLLLFSEKCQINLKNALIKKMEINKIKYPIEKSKGVSTKYDQL